MDLMKMVYVIIGITISVIIAAKELIVSVSRRVLSFGKCAVARDTGSDEPVHRYSEGRGNVDDSDHPYRNSYNYRNCNDGC